MIDEKIEFKPQFFYVENDADEKAFNKLKHTKTIEYFDFYIPQLRELYKIRNPNKQLTEADYSEHVAALSSNTNFDKKGVWVYYSWANYAVHILEEAEFIEIRTSRNQYKITKEEQRLLQTKKVGIIGLSVGQSVALTMAIERIAGEFLLADFDTLELSNLNRLRAPLKSLYLPKCVITAREMYEIDPYLKISIYPEGIDENNIEAFLTKNKNLDLLIDECDSLDIKILCRLKARNHKIPVIMETSDKGMLDIERFDLEPEREIFHSMLQGLDYIDGQKLSPQQKQEVFLRIIDLSKVSERGKYSLSEMGKTIGTWPQLASAVTIGGGVVTDTCRKIFLNHFTKSGRYYVDLDNIVA
jgi:molybdopterin/thiamine biosynthesis adenylyltransferase